MPLEAELPWLRITELEHVEIHIKELKYVKYCISCIDCI